MANTKTGLKRAKTSAKSNLRNRASKAAIKTVEKKLRTSISGKDAIVAGEKFKEISSKLDKAAKSGKIHKNKADRKKSRLAKAINSSLKAEAKAE